MRLPGHAMRKIFCGTILAAVVATMAFGDIVAARKPMADGARIGDRAALGRIIRDIPYAPENARFGLGDLYLPERVTPETPVVLTIHGGGWSAGDRYSWSGVAEFFCRELGCVSFNIEYRLASAANRWPACGDDCLKAANWLFTDAFRERAGFSPKKIYICGGSAGGHLTLWTLVNMPPEKVAGAISISSIGDPEPDFRVHAGRYRALFGKSCGKDKLANMNPIRAITSGRAPILCTHATEDKVVPIGSHKAFADAYRAAGNMCEFFEYPTTIQDGLSGHCIWIPNSKPHRLIPEIEEKIKEFMKRVSRGLPGVATKSKGSAPRLAFQVYAVRDLCAKDFVGTLKAAKAMGYEGVETGRFYGLDAGEMPQMRDSSFA